ncbi:MAG TPA: hypothetical protein VJ746_01750 [Nitrospira sp.]|nr:hypothetical protein [Nitrospira sp.]
MNNFFFLMGLGVYLIAVGCQKPLEMKDSTCSMMNNPLEIKPSAEVSFLFGTDAIRAALDRMLSRLREESAISDQTLIDSGADSAIKSATVNGRQPTANDVSMLKSYLSQEVVPVIHQHPMCDFLVNIVGKPNVAIERVIMKSIGAHLLPQVMIQNTGQVDAQCHVFIKQFLRDVEHSSGSIDFRLGPDQRKGLSMRDMPLPIAEIESGTSKMLLVVSIWYSPEMTGPKVFHKETWQYDAPSRVFVLVSSH